MKFIVWTWFEIEFLIKRPCLQVDGVNQNRSNSEDIRSPFDPEQSVFEQRGAQAVPLLLPVYRQSSEQSNRYGMPCQPLSGSAGGPAARGAK